MSRSSNFKKLAVCLPYAVTIRDFIHSGTLAKLVGCKKYKVVIYTLNPEAPELERARETGAVIKKLHQGNESKFESIAKKLYPLFFVDLFYYLEESLEDRYLLRFMASTFSMMRKIAGTDRVLNSFRAVLLNLYKKRASLVEQLDNDLDLVIGTRSLINSIDYDLIAEAALKKIPIYTIAGSWDNFTTKGYFPFGAVKTAVWNEKMKNELVSLFDLPPDFIDVVGYSRANTLRSCVDDINAKTYLRNIGVDGFNKFILYSASYGELTRVDSYAAPLEYISIKNIMKELVQELPSDFCVLIRLHPFSKAEDAEYLSDLERCHVFVPGRKDVYVERVMGMGDERHLANQLNLAECIVSLASTVSIDALTLNKPIININYDPVSGLLQRESPTRFYKWNHFRDLVCIAGLPLANSYHDVESFVFSCISGNYVSEVDMESFHQMYVPALSADYSDNLFNSIECVLE